MKNFLLTALTVTLGSISLGAEELPVIVTERPDGDVKEYWLDQRNEDNLFGMMYDCHSTQSIVFADDNVVWLPNPLMRNSMPAYIKGVYDPAEKTVTVEPGQPVYQTPNTDQVLTLRLYDRAFRAGNSVTKEFYDEKIIFDVDDNGVFKMRVNEKRPHLVICTAEYPEYDQTTNSDVYYALANDISFTPTALHKDDNIKLDYVYTNRADMTSTRVAASYYRDGDTFWFLGLDPKYPAAWLKADLVDGQLRMPSFQVVSFTSYDFPIVFAALSADYSGTEPEYVAYNFLPFEYDEPLGRFEAAAEQPYASNLGNSTGQNDQPEVYQIYSSLLLTPAAESTNVPVDPVYYDNFFEFKPGGETEFTFTSAAVATDGHPLGKESLCFRFYVNGELYTFNTTDYPFHEAMTEIPYNFSQYGYVMHGGDLGEKRYIYFQNLPAATKTIEVETVYKDGDDEYKSRRLVFDVINKNASYGTSGISSITTERRAMSVSYHDMQGRPTDAGSNVLKVRTTVYDDGSVESVKVFKVD